MKTTLLIMAAGLGSRYGGDKQVDGIGPHGEMLMQYSIYDAVKAGFDKLVFVIKPTYKEIIDKLCSGLSGVEVACVYQDFDSIPTFYKVPADRVKPFGTVHAVLSACVKSAMGGCENVNMEVFVEACDQIKNEEVSLNSLVSIYLNQSSSSKSNN